MRKKVAIITRTKSRPLLLDRCMQSGLSQGFKDWVHVVVNDGGCTDQVAMLAEKYREQYGDRLVLIDNIESFGMERSSNIGIRASNSEMIAILDDDDSWHPDFLSEMVLRLERAGGGIRGAICYTDVVFEHIEGGCVVEEKRVPYPINAQSGDLSKIISTNRFVPVAFLFFRSVLDIIGWFDETLAVCGDWEFHVRFIEKYDLLIVPITLAYYHQRRSSDDEYGNSVIASADLHLSYRVILSSRWLREALESNRISYGELYVLGQIADRLERIETLLERGERRRHFIRNAFRRIRRWRMVKH